MKRNILIFLLIIGTLLSLAGCTKYKPQESSDKEAETVLTITYDNNSYEVPYELYRTFFLNYKKRVDGGDNTVWQGENKAEYINEIEELIFDSIAEIYAVFHLCLEEDIDPHSRSVDKVIENYIIASVEGGSVDGMRFSGHGGDYDAYLNSLKERNMNYSVQEILYRYAICSELLDEHFSKKINNKGDASFTKEDVKSFYDSDSCVRVIERFFPLLTELDKEQNTEEKISEIRHGMLLRATDEDDLCTYLISTSGYNDDLRNGVLIGKYSHDRNSYGELTDAAFSLSHHEVSEIIKVINGTSDGYYLLYKVEKSDEHFNKCYNSIEAIYIANMIGEELNTAKTGLIGGIERADALINIDHSKISME